MKDSGRLLTGRNAFWLVVGVLIVCGPAIAGCQRVADSTGSRDGQAVLPTARKPTFDGGRREAAPTRAPNAESSSPPPVQIVENAPPRPLDAVPTGGPYLAANLRQLLRDAGIADDGIQIRVTAAAVILEGVVDSEDSRARAERVVRRHSPEQLDVETRLRISPVRGSRERPEVLPESDAGMR
jgi:BON domain